MGNGNREYMRKVTTTIEVYKFDELSEESQIKAVEAVQNDESYLSYDWWDSCYECFKDRHGHLFDIDRIYFSGFWSQGDGAMFEYSFLYEEAWLDLFLDNQKDMSDTRKAMIKRYCCISGKGTHRGHYYHENCCSHSVYIEADVDSCHTNIIDYVSEDLQEDFEDFFEDYYKEICGELYRTLEKDYEYLTSREAIEEHLIDNDAEFEKDGTRY